MAFGQLQGGGLLDPPSVPQLGYDDWASMTGMSPAHPLVGGSAGSPGYGAGQRTVAVANPQPMAALDAPARSNWSEIFNLSGSPIGWVLIAAILYLGLMHVHVRGGVNVGGGVGKV